MLLVGSLLALERTEVIDGREEYSVTYYSKEFAEKFNLPKDSIAELSPYMHVLEFQRVYPSWFGGAQCWFNFVLEKDAPVYIHIDQHLGEDGRKRADLNYSVRKRLLNLELPKHIGPTDYLLGSFGISTADYSPGERGHFESLYVAQMLPKYIDGYNYFSKQGLCDPFVRMFQRKQGWIFKSYVPIEIWGHEEGYQPKHYFVDYIDGRRVERVEGSPTLMWKPFRLPEVLSEKIRQKLNGGEHK